MAETETVEQVEAPEGTNETPTPAENAEPAVTETVQETPATPEEKPEKVKVFEMGPKLVEAAPPKEIDLPDTPEIRRILQLYVPIIVRLAGKIMPLGEIMQLQPGAIIEFSKVIGEDLDLMINNKCIGGGQAVKVGEKFGLKVTQIATIDKMILALGGK
jgi:flagellar motor switch protein FliN